MTRYDAVNYIAHGIAKKPGMSEAASPSKAPAEKEDEADQAGRRGAGGLLRRPQREGPPGQDRPADRPPCRGRARDPDPVPPHQEQPAAGGRPRRRQDRHRRGPGPQDRRRRSARDPGRRDHLLARHGRAAGRHPLSRRLRGAAEAGGQGAGGAPQRRPVHRRDPHGDRRRRHLRRGDGRLQPAEAGAAVRPAALHGLDHLQGVPPALREGPGAGPPLPEDRRQRADASRTRSRS